MRYQKIIKMGGTKGTSVKEKITPKESDDIVEKNDNECINISISKQAYDVLEKFTKELNQANSNNQKPFTVEEVLNEEIILLFNNEWDKKAITTTVQSNNESTNP